MSFDFPFCKIVRSSVMLLLLLFTHILQHVLYTKWLTVRSFILPTLVHFICYHLLKIVWLAIGICMILTPLWPLSYETTIASIAWDHCVLDPMRPPCPQSYGTTVSSILWGHHALDRMGPLCPRSYETTMPSIVWDHCVLDPKRPPCPRSYGTTVS
jgi:hypothetical protein